MKNKSILTIILLICIGNSFEIIPGFKWIAYDKNQYGSNQYSNNTRRVYQVGADIAQFTRVFYYSLGGHIGYLPGNFNASIDSKINFYIQNDNVTPYLGIGIDLLSVFDKKSVSNPAFGGATYHMWKVTPEINVGIKIKSKLILFGESTIDKDKFTIGFGYIL